MADFTIGVYDYTYIHSADPIVGIKVNDTTLEEYPAISSTVWDPVREQECDVMNMDYCFADCQNLKESPDIPQTIVSMNGCFLKCSSLTTVGILPDGLKSMKSCFESCFSLEESPDIPLTVTELNNCFWGCTSLVDAPTLPDNNSELIDISYCFCNCTSLQTAPTIPNSVINMDGCFSNCQSLEQAPRIPSSVDRMFYCFYNCISLKGGLRVRNNPTYYTNVLGNTTKDICILDESNSTVWQSVAGDNIFYEADGQYKRVENEDYIFNYRQVADGKPIYVFNKNKVSYQPIPNLSNNINRCFEGCVNLIEAPEIPDIITSMDYTFKGCTSLTGFIRVPSNIRSCEGVFDDTVEDIYIYYFGDTTKWVEVAAQYDNVYLQLPQIYFDSGGYRYTINNTNLSCRVLDTTKTSYEQMIDTTYINGQLYTTTDLSNCFDGCNALVSSPTIPSSVTNISNCFNGCIELTGNIVVQTNLINSSSNAFSGTAKNIFIVRGPGVEESVLRAIAQQYTNVHFEADDNRAPAMPDHTVDRGVHQGNVWIDSSDGNALKIVVKAVVFKDLLPSGSDWDNYLNPSHPTVLLNGTVYPIYNWTQVDNIYTAYIDNVSTEEKINVEIRVTDRFNKTTSWNTVISSIFVMLDFRPGGKGMGIGRSADQDGLTVRIPTRIGRELIPPLKDGKVDLNKYQLVIGQYNKQNDDADFVVGGGTAELRRNSFEIKNGGLYSYDQANVPVMEIETTNNVTVMEDDRKEGITGDTSYSINGIKLATSGNITYTIDYQTTVISYQLTTDTAVDFSKTYYELINNEYVEVQITDPDIDPHDLSYYEKITTIESASQQASFPVAIDYTQTENLIIDSEIIGTIAFKMEATQISVTIVRTDTVTRTMDVEVEFPVVVENYITYNFGKYLNRSRDLQFTIGQYNKNSNINLFEIGNGSASNRSNAFAVDYQGNIIIGNNGIICNDGVRGRRGMIWFIDNATNADGNGIRIGGGGVTLVGSGEYANNRWNVGDLKPDTEQLYLGSDNNVYIETNAQTVANRKTFLFNSNGNLVMPNSICLENADGRIFCKDPSGTYRDCLHLSASNNLHLGYGMYTAKVGNTYVNGNNTYIRAQGSLNINNQNVMSQTKNKVYASPSNATGAATFRALVAADIPPLNASKITTGTLDADILPSIAASKITGTLADARIPTTILRKSELVGQTFSKTSISISANNYIANQTLDVTKSGYTAIGLIGMWCAGTNSSFALPYCAYLDGNTVKYNIRNFATTAASINFYVRVLYKES